MNDPADYAPGPADYVASPTTPEDFLSADELRAVYLALVSRSLDLVIVSRGLDPAPAVRSSGLRDTAVVRADLRPCLEGRRPFPGRLNGRIIRSMPSADDDVPTATLERLLGRPCGVVDQTFHTGTASAPIPADAPAAGTALPLDPSVATDARPLVLVLPGLFAVGGVERNTVEIIRELEADYRFVVITNEPLDPVRGSLHRQLRGLCEGVYDLGEIAPRDTHLHLLRELDRCHGFDCIWIVNGSTWLAENIAALRAAFADVPIIDQQVYDTTHGWISNYAKPEIRDFDVHIAINRRIADAFVDRFGIAEDRIRLIYHAIDDRKWADVASDRARGESLRKAWGVPAGVPLYGCIGRLTDQKRPLDFLELARRARAEGVPGVFALVGDGELRDACRDFVSRHGLTNVVMPGFLEEPADVHAALAGLVVTSAYEGLPIVSLEAMAVGVPILATDVGDLRLVGERHGSITLFGAADAAGRFAEFRRWSDALPALAAVARRAAPDVRSAFGAATISARYAAVFADALAVRRRVPARRRPTDCVGVSIVMPTFNRADLLETAIRRYADCMDGLDCELIVVDDGSTDDTADVLDRCARDDDRIRFTSLSNGGPARARNVGAGMARKEVVLFVGDDILPCDERFVRTHARLHAVHADAGFAVLGKAVWPTDDGAVVNAVMRHVQGFGGEQFGYAHLRPYEPLDWRFFYTCNVSVKRTIVADWSESGFSADFPSAAFEDIEFAYRMSRRPEGLRIYYDPASRGEHHHVHTVRTFCDRQFTVGMMGAVFVARHPEAARDLGFEKLVRVMDRGAGAARPLHVADLLSVIEGVKSFAFLLEARGGLGDAHWHTAFLQALFEMVMFQGFIAGWAPHAAHADAGYESVLAAFLKRVESTTTVEAPGLHAPFALLHGLLAAA